MDNYEIEEMRRAEMEKIDRQYRSSVASVLSTMAAASASMWLHPSPKVAADAMMESFRYQLAASVAYTCPEAALAILKKPTQPQEGQ